MSVRSPFRPPDQLLLPWSPERSITVTRAADMLDCSHDTILSMIESGALKAYRWRHRKGCKWKVNYDSVIKMLEQIHTTNGLEKRF